MKTRRYEACEIASVGLAILNILTYGTALTSSCMLDTWNHLRWGWFVFTILIGIANVILMSIVFGYSVSTVESEKHNFVMLLGASLINHVFAFTSIGTLVFLIDVPYYQVWSGIGVILTACVWTFTWSFLRLCLNRSV